MARDLNRIARFVVVGLAATAVHFGVLTFLVKWWGVPSVGLANGFAAVVGITTSYLGNHGFVFDSQDRHAKAAPRFLAAYALVALLHAGLMALWADWAGLDYRIGFVVFTVVSAATTYLLNRFFVFRVQGETGGTTT